MKTGKILSVILVMLTLTAVLSGCAGNNDSRNVIYEDMQAAFQKANLLSANIGIFSKTEKDGAVSYGECGTGSKKRKTGLQRRPDRPALRYPAYP